FAAGEWADEPMAEDASVQYLESEKKAVEITKEEAPLELDWESDDDADGVRQRHKGDEGMMGRPSKRKAPTSRSSFGSKLASKQLQEYDASTVIQTGPGVPSWNWRRIGLSWSGPVDRDQQLRFFLLNPTANLSLALVRVAFMTLLSLVVFGVFGGRRRREETGAGKGKGKAQAAALALGIGLTAALAPRPAASSSRVRRSSSAGGPSSVIGSRLPWTTRAEPTTSIARPRS
ncbi:MAG: hypothetical protein KC420_22400, partial [Myxococcales bacterium]|nr:hypothetical protein [Myxococcales bacterium]